MTDHAITLYFALEPEHQASIKAVAQAAIAFDKLVSEVAYIIEPGADFQVVFERSAPGSLRIISRLKGAITKERLTRLAATIALLITTNGVTYVQTMGMDELRTRVMEIDRTLTEEDVTAIAQAIQNLEKSRTVSGPRADLYRAIRDDPAITGFGSRADDQDAPPARIISREDFDRMAIGTPAPEEDGDKRTEILRQNILLDQPTLISPKSTFGFVNSQGTFRARVTDRHFLEALRDGQTNLRLSSGIVLDATVEIKQQREAGIWRNKRYVITHVHDWRHDAEQTEMILSKPGDQDDQPD